MNLHQVLVQMTTVDIAKKMNRMMLAWTIGGCHDFAADCAPIAFVPDKLTLSPSFALKDDF